MKTKNSGLLHLIYQFCSYFCVGGVAALVEWGCFFLLCNLLHIWYAAATVISFLISTLVNYLLGRRWTFKIQSGGKKTLHEALAVYAVSAVGLLFNLILMYFFVDLLNLSAMLSKIGATGIVFIWNFLSRKFFIYKKNEERVT